MNRVLVSAVFTNVANTSYSIELRLSLPNTSFNIDNISIGNTAPVTYSPANQWIVGNFGNFVFSPIQVVTADANATYNTYCLTYPSN